jgi:NAD(P)-dependent dehydrogenase (short-subunit alcohol dehydrogenase family)
MSLLFVQEYKIVDGGFERTIASNYFGAFWLTQLLLEDLKANAPAR